MGPVAPGIVIHSAAMTGVRSIDYRRARSIMLLSGMIVIGLVVITMLIRRVDPIEVIATVSFAPIFVAMLVFGWRAGAGIGLAAAGLYLALRLPAIRLVGLGPMLGLVLSRTVGFVAFGSIGGWAASELGAAIGKLELYDSIDDATGLGNARSVLDVVDRERARAARHATLFSVVTARFPMPSGRSRRSRALRDLGRSLVGAVRASDHVAHLPGTNAGTVVLVLPETGPEGARTVAGSLASRLSALVGGDVDTTVLTIPGNEDQLDGLVAAATEIDVGSRPGPSVRE